jgi:polygalacturonase
MNRNTAVRVLCGLLVCSAFAAQAAEFRVKDYGAKGDGRTTDTAAIQRTIDAASQAGGGEVVFPAGTYLTGAIFLKSHTHLRVDRGVTLLGSQKLADYPILPTRVAGIEMKWPAALVNVYEQSDVSISGPGLIDGNGKVWWDGYWKLRRAYEARGLRWAADYDSQRPRLIQIYKSSHILLSGVNLHRSGFWTVHICYSSHVNVDGVTIRNNIGGKGPSTDGVDIDSSSGVLVERADISVNDDALCLKSGRDADGLRVGRPTTDVVIRDSTVRAGAAGVTIGSETSGGFRHIDIYGLHVYQPVPSGILFKSAPTRGGIAQDINIHGIELTGVAVPIRIDMNWNPSYSIAALPAGIRNEPDYWKVMTEKVSQEQGRPHFRDVSISNVTATGAKEAFSVEAYPDAPLVNFHFQNIRIQTQSAGFIRDAKDWSFRQTKLDIADGSHVHVSDSVDVLGLP